MPTGYTACVKDGSVTTLRVFALRCARAFGVAADMRDEDPAVPVPEKVVARTARYDDDIRNGIKSLEEIQAMSLVDCELAAEAEYNERVEGDKRYAAEKRLSAERYQTMIVAVEAWNVGAELHGLKKFMLEQLADSLKYDCGTTFELPKPKQLTGREWREKKIKYLSEEIGRDYRHRAEVVARAAEHNEYLAALYAALLEGGA